MHYHSQNREIVVSTELKLEFPRDDSTAIQLIANKPIARIIHSFQTYKIPQERECFISVLKDYRKLTYRQDVIAHVPNHNEKVQDGLVHYLIKLRNEFFENKNITKANEITEQLRLMGIVIVDKPNTQLFWNQEGEMRKS